MKYYHAIYVEEKLLSKKMEILRKIENDEYQFEMYLISLTKNEKNHLEIFHSVLLNQKAISKEGLFIVGIARGYQAVLELVEKITQEVYDETEGVDISNYILRKQQEYEKGNV